jgi:hypothetical protein
MILELTKEDNDIIINHLYVYNKGVETHMKMAMDTYVDALEFVDDDIIFHTSRIKPILLGGITEDNVGKSKGEIGAKTSIKLSGFEKPYDDILLQAIREIKLSRVI